MVWYSGSFKYVAAPNQRIDGFDELVPHDPSEEPPRLIEDEDSQTTWLEDDGSGRFPSVETIGSHLIYLFIYLFLHTRPLVAVLFRRNTTGGLGRLIERRRASPLLHRRPPRLPSRGYYRSIVAAAAAGCACVSRSAMASRPSPRALPAGDRPSPFPLLDRRPRPAASDTTPRPRRRAAACRRPRRRNSGSRRAARSKTATTRGGRRTPPRGGTCSLARPACVVPCHFRCTVLRCRGRRPTRRSRRLSWRRRRPSVRNAGRLCSLCKAMQHWVAAMALRRDSNIWQLYLIKAVYRASPRAGHRCSAFAQALCRQKARPVRH